MQSTYNYSRCLISTLYFTLTFIGAVAQDTSVVPAKFKKLNSIGIKYDLTQFINSPVDPWHQLSVEYGRQKPGMPLIARVNIARRFSKQGFQFEADAYPALSKKMYLYLSAGYAPGDLLFPKFRAGASLYISLPSAFEAEGGLRFLYFNSPAWIYLAGFGKYYKKFFFQLNGFLSPASQAVSQSYFAKCRFYLNDTDYLMLLAGTGISPDDRNYNAALNSPAKRTAQRVEFSWKKTYRKTNILLFDIGFMKQRSSLHRYPGQLNFGIGLKKLF